MRQPDKAVRRPRQVVQLLDGVEVAAQGDLLPHILQGEHRRHEASLPHVAEPFLLDARLHFRRLGVHVHPQRRQHVSHRHAMLGRHVLLPLHDDRHPGRHGHDRRRRADHQVSLAPVVGAADVQQPLHPGLDQAGAGTNGVGEPQQLLRRLPLEPLDKKEAPI